MESFWVLVGVLLISAAFFLASLAITNNYEQRAKSRLERAGWQGLFCTALVIGTFLSWTFSGPETYGTIAGNAVVAIGIVLIPYTFALLMRALIARDHERLNEKR